MNDWSCCNPVPLTDGVKRWELTRDQLDKLVLEHCMPGPGNGLIALWYRPPYERHERLFYVPEAELIRASSAATQASVSGDKTASTATTSAGVAPGSNESVMARAVNKRSYTRRAARPSSVRPMRSTMRRRASNGSVLLIVLMLSLLSAKSVGSANRTLAMKGGVL